MVTQRVRYDIEKIKKYIPRDILPLIINKSITIQNYDEFASYMKQIGASSKVVKSFLSISETVNESELDKLYQKGKIDYDDIKKCASIEEGKPYLRFSTFDE